LFPEKGDRGYGLPLQVMFHWYMGRLSINFRGTTRKGIRGRGVVSQSDRNSLKKTLVRKKKVLTGG
jgi:hypothetical protein